MKAFITPDGDSLNNVYRLNREIVTKYHLSPNSDSTFLAREHETYCFVLGYDWPILYQYKPVKPTGDIQSYYYPIQSNQDGDIALFFHDGVNGSETDRVNREKVHLEYELTNDTSSRTIRVTYKLSRETDITFILSSLDGIVFYTKKQHTQSAQQSCFAYNYSGLRRGQYVVYMEADDTRYESKFDVK